MFDFGTGLWQPGRDTIAEAVMVPARSAGGWYRVLDGQRGLVRRAGRVDALQLHGQEPAANVLPGDRAYWWRQPWPPLPFRQLPVHGRLLTFTATLEVADPERFCRWLGDAGKE